MYSLRESLTLDHLYIEPYYGCNRTCEFCGMTTLKPNKFKEMSLEMAEKIAQQLPDLENCQKQGRLRIEFAMRGEPTLHSNLPEIIQIFNNYRDLAEIRILTNGDFLTKQLADNLFNAGCNIIAVDNYDGNYEQRKQEYLEFGYEIIDESLLKHIAMYYGSDVQAIFMLKPTWERTIINNQCGYMDQSKLKDNKFEKKFSNKKLTKEINAFCPCPFVTMTIYYDGTLSICPTNWTNDGVISNIDNETSLKNYWYKNQQLNEIRKNFKNENKRLCKSCKDCDYDFFKFYSEDFINWAKGKGL